MKALALNGGGMAAYRTARFLQYLEEETHIQCWRLFDLVAGVSAGSIIAAMLAKKMPAKEICELFKEMKPVVFGKKHNLFTRLFWNPQYPRDGLDKIIGEYADFKMGDSALKLMIYALEINNNEKKVKPRHWKSWVDTEVMVSDTVIASSASPSYFKPYTFDDIVNGETETKTFTDGGIITNNPTMSVVSEAISLGENIDKLYVVNIGIGKAGGVEAKNFVSLFDIAQRFPFITIAATERCDEYHAHQIIGFRNHVVDPKEFIGGVDVNLDILDASAAQLWEEHGKNIIDKLAEL